jgi:hypothetical protein
MKDYDFGKIKKCNTILNEDENIISRAYSQDCGYIVEDNLGNIRLIREGETPSFDYQKKYKLNRYFDNDGVNCSFISVKDTEVINNLVENWSNPHEKLLNMRKNIKISQRDEGEWEAPSKDVENLLTEWKKVYPYISNGDNIGGYITSSNKSSDTQKFKETGFTVVKIGMNLSCSNCSESGITLEMNFCPNCGFKFS